MIRAIAAGIWVVAVTLGATYAGAYLKLLASHPATSEHSPAKLEVKKVKPISVPVISDGKLTGYVSAEFSYVADAAKTEHAALDPESFIMNEAFRLLYSQNDVDFTHFEKPDLENLTRQITENVNARLGSERIKQILVKNMTFVPKDELPR